MRPRQIPADPTLSRLFAVHADLSDADLIRRYRWAVSRGAVAAHRRRLTRAANPIAGSSALSGEEFRARMEYTTAEQHWAVTGFDTSGVTRLPSHQKEG